MTQTRNALAGMSRAEIDRAENKDFALGAGPKRPRDAATLILLDDSGDEFRVLMGRRHMKHAFMPGKFVFPGGRTDPADSRIPVAAGLHPDEESKLVGKRTSLARARAIALSAVRETYEEAGLLLGRKGEFATSKADWQGFVEHQVFPALDTLRFVARAITPPGRPKRFDTRFFAVDASQIAERIDGVVNADTELTELVWVELEEAHQLDLPSITTVVLKELEQRTALGFHHELPVPFFNPLRGRFQREEL